MSDLRLPYARTAMAGLKNNANAESAVDRVAAAGRCNAVGIDLWKTAYGLEKSAFYRLRAEIIKLFLKRYPRETCAEKLVEQAIHEFCGPGCTECEGTGMVGNLELETPRGICPTCGGTKIRRYSDTTRAAMMQLSYAKTKHLAFKIGWVIKVLSGEDKTTNTTMNRELERDQI